MCTAHERYYKSLETPLGAFEISRDLKANLIYGVFIHFNNSLKIIQSFVFSF